MAETKLQDFVFERIVNYFQSRGLDASKVKAISLPIEEYAPVMIAQFALNNFPERVEPVVFAGIIKDYNVEQRREEIKPRDQSAITLDFYEGDNVYRYLVSPIGLNAKISEFKFPNASALRR